ncbi:MULTISPECIES: nitroreductase family protein [Clostridium]|uniref:nitroreductase family protein n=1 Tax=Clostridium TaxID=1485 RepID=UPI00145DA639|nr:MULTISPECIES: nitroreductase family protein [Clostridium]MBI6106785.1 nitroreductase family protein [Clostridium perfringens]NME83585.1 4Fe-4S binding protein [Clostridium sp. SM-530-WT-3G]
MIVNTDKCIGCTLCTQDCIVSDIEMVNGKAHIKNEACIGCGHCIAICPAGAVSCDDEKEYSMDEVMEYNKEDFDIAPERLMNFMKFRRSVRLFKKDEVEEEKIQKILEAGKYSQTGSNMQAVSYVVVKDKMQELRKMVLETLNSVADVVMNKEGVPQAYIVYAKMWKKMYTDFLENPDGEDRLFFKAPLMIVVKADRVINGALAASKMELMIDALGLGTFFSGFLERALADNPKIGELLQIKEGEQFVACMLVGYPRVKYKRTVPRKEINVVRM